ncbi:MAG: hypothetical protein MUE33_11385 [Cytophagaceae bacterium]|nr:hypothetical protein [Cytophagaceae bacterium]
MDTTAFFNPAVVGLNVMVKVVVFPAATLVLLAGVTLKLPASVPLILIVPIVKDAAPTFSMVKLIGALLEPETTDGKIWLPVPDTILFIPCLTLISAAGAAVAVPVIVKV